MTGAKLAVGLDVGGTNTRAVAFEPDGTIVADVRRPTDARGAESVIGSTLAALGELGSAVGRSPDRFGLVGVGIPGAVDPDGGTVRYAVNLGIDGAPVDLGARLTEAVGVPFHIENDVNAGALGVASLDPDGAAGGLVYLSIGTGIAAGVVIDGRLWRGHRGLAGEIGHVPVDRSGPACRCGRRGCFEAVASGTAIARRWPVATDERGVGEEAGEALFAAAARGDRAACVIRDEVVGHLARGIEMLALAYDVERIVIGGGVAGIGEPLESALLATLAGAAESRSVPDLDLADRVRLAPAGVPLGAWGAALAARQAVDGGRS